MMGTRIQVRARFGRIPVPMRRPKHPPLSRVNLVFTFFTLLIAHVAHRLTAFHPKRIIRSHGRLCPLDFLVVLQKCW